MTTTTQKTETILSMKVYGYPNGQSEELFVTATAEPHIIKVKGFGLFHEDDFQIGDPAEMLEAFGVEFEPSALLVADVFHAIDSPPCDVLGCCNN